MGGLATILLVHDCMKLITCDRNIIHNRDPYLMSCKYTYLGIDGGLVQLGELCLLVFGVEIQLGILGKVIEVKVEHSKYFCRFVVYNAVQLFVKEDGSGEGTLVVTRKLIDFANALDSRGIGDEGVVALVGAMAKGVGESLVSR